MALRNDYLIDQVQAGDEIEVWWPADRQYYPGIIDDILSNGRYRITYLDGEVEKLRLSNERWRFRGNAAERVSRAHSASPRKRSRNLFTTHEPEPIVIDDDDDVDDDGDPESPPKRARHKQRTHHSNDAVITLDGSLSLSTQQSDVEIEEVPVQRNPRGVSDHRASDVSDPIVSDIEHEVIEEEILDRGYGGDTSSAADTSELQHHYARGNKSTTQNRSTHHKSPHTAIQSIPPRTSPNCHKDHRNSYSAQSASLSAPNNYTSPNNAPSALGNRADPIISPAPLAAYQLSPNRNKPPANPPESPPLKLPPSAVNRSIVSGSRATAKAASGLPVNPDVRNITSKTTSGKLSLSMQERSVSKSSAGIAATALPKLTHRKGAVQDATSNLVSQRRKTGKPSVSSPHMRASKAAAQTTSKEATVNKNTQSTGVNGRSERMGRTTTDVTKSNSITVTKSKTLLTRNLQRTTNGPAVQTTSEPPHIVLAPAVKMSKPSMGNQSVSHGTFPEAKTKMSGATTSPATKTQQTIGVKPNSSSGNVVGLPSRNPTNVDPNTSVAVRKQSSLHLKSPGSAKNAKHTPQKNNGGTEKDSHRTTTPLSTGAQAGIAVARTHNIPPSINVGPQKSLPKQLMSSTQNKMVATSTRTETPSERPANVVSQRSLTKQLMPSTQNKAVVTKAQAMVPSKRSANTIPQTSVTKQSVSAPQSKKIATPTQASTLSMQRTISAGDHRQVPSGSSAGPRTFKATVENGSHERPKTNAPNHATPKLKSRVSQSKSVVSEAMKSTYVGQSKSAIEPADINTSTMPKQVADARAEIVKAGSSNTSKQLPIDSAVMRKKARHPSPKVVSNERIPRNKPLSVSYSSRSLRMDVPRTQSHIYENAGSSRHSSGIDQRLGPNTPMKPIPRISSPTPPRVHLENASMTRDMPNSQSVGTTTTVATQEACIPLGRSKSHTDGRKTQPQLPRPSMPKSSGSISIQSLVSSPKDVTQPHRGSSNLQNNGLPGVLFQSHLGSARSLALVPNSRTASSSASKLYAATTSTTTRLYAAPPLPSLPNVSCAASTLNGRRIQTQQSAPQTSSSLQAVANPKASNLQETGTKQVSIIAKGSTPSINSGLSKELQPLRATRRAHVDKESGVERGRKRSASEYGNLAGATKRRKPLSSTAHPAGLRDVNDTRNPQGGIRVSSEAASAGNRMNELDHTTRDASVSPCETTLQWAHGTNRVPPLVAGATTFLSTGSQALTSGPLNSATAKTRANLQRQVSTTPNVVDPSAIISSQRTTSAPMVTPAFSVSTQLPFATTPRNPYDQGGASILQPRIVPSYVVASVQPATRISVVPEMKNDSEDIERLMSDALRTVDDKFSMISKKTKEEFEGLKKSVDSMSRDIAQLGTRIEKVDRDCKSSSDNFLKVLEKSLDKKMAEMNQQILSEAQESLVVERLRFKSSSKEIAQRITQVTSTLFHSALQDVKTTVGEDYRRIQSEVAQSSPKVKLLEENHTPTSGPRRNNREVASRSDGNESINSIAPGRNTEKPERQLEPGLPVGFPSYQQMSNSFSQCSTPLLRDGRVNESNSTGTSHQGVSPQSLEGKSNDLIARCVIEWLQNGGCRKKAPRSERNIQVTQAWVNSTTLKCFDSIISRLQPWKSVSEAEAGVAKSLAGKVVEIEWLTRFTDDTCVERARAIYNGWEPKLFEFEWLTEKKVMLEIAKRVNKAQGELAVDKVHYPDALSRSLSCMKRARSVG
ncbi:mucin-2 [Gracilaria domingensis]|nr:mucin-2 [Gracilaria domingensis]